MIFLWLLVSLKFWFRERCISGATGAGYKGDTGAAGPQGATGPQGIQGETGATGATGAKGDTGATGAGVPSGGASGQILTKKSATDYDTEWADPASASKTFAIAMAIALG